MLIKPEETLSPGKYLWLNRSLIWEIAMFSATHTKTKALVTYTYNAQTDITGICI